MFYPASVLLRRFSVYASSHKLLRKELMAFIDFLCHLPAYIGQVEKSTSSIVRKPPSRRTPTAD